MKLDVAFGAWPVRWLVGRNIELKRALYDGFALSVPAHAMKQIDLVDIIIVDSFARHADRLAEDTDLAAWLFTIARNRYRSHRRSAVEDGDLLLKTRRRVPLARSGEL